MMTNIVQFFVITMAVVRCSACPIMCVCLNHSNHSNDIVTGYANTHCNREEIASKHPNSTRCLEVSNLNETEVKYFVENVLIYKARPTCQTHLKLVYCVIPDNITFSDLELVEELDLSENNIGTLQQLFFNLPNLKLLDLSKNEIKIINNQPFNLLKNLKYLNLSSNSIFKIESDSFYNLSVLVNVDLAKNNLKSFSESVFQKVASLQFLNLSHNNFESLNANCFRNLVELQELDISFNQLMRVSSAIHLPGLTSLNLNGNTELAISEEPYLFLITGGHLQIVDASFIGVKQIPAALTISIRILLLVGNAIYTVRRGDFDSYPLLQYLDLTSNGLVSIEYDALGRLNYLSALYLNNNSLEEFPKSLPENLKILNIEANKIRSLSSKDLDGLHHLEVLFLNDNNISIIFSDTFNKLEAVTALDISNNPLLTLENGCMLGPKKLQHLRLSNLTLNFSNETSLNFSVNLENLLFLDLSGSSGLVTHFLNANILNASKNIEDLNLSNANISYVPKYLLFYLRKLRLLHLEGNKLDCKKMQWLAAWMYRNSRSEYNHLVKCFSPPELQGTPLMNLTKVQLNSSLFVKDDNGIAPVTLTKPLDRLKNMYSKSSNHEAFSTIFDDEFSESSNNTHNFTSLKSLYLNTKAISVTREINDAEIKWSSPDRIQSPLPDADKKQDHVFQSTFFIVIEISTMVLLIVVLVVIRIVKRRKLHKVVDQQEEEMFNASSIIELW